VEPLSFVKGLTSWKLVLTSACWVGGLVCSDLMGSLKLKLRMLQNASKNFKWIQDSENLLYNASKYFKKFQMDPRVSTHPRQKTQHFAPR
jgi:hypothetical protein